MNFEINYFVFFRFNSTAGSKRPRTEENFGPIPRNRSQSANEASKPLSHRLKIGLKSNVSGKSKHVPVSLLLEFVLV